MTKQIYIVEWECPVCNAIFACNRGQDCPKCGQAQVLGTIRGGIIRDLENGDYYKLYTDYV